MNVTRSGSARRVWPGWFGRWRSDERGAVLIMVTLTLPVILGLAAIVIDLGRLAAQQTEFQSFADHVALAAAGELDGEAGARERARTAAGLITADRQTFTQGTIQLAAAADITLRFLADLPASDNDPVTDAFLAANDVDARFVEATVVPRTVVFGLTRAFSALIGGGLADSRQVGATAVAGFTGFVCDITPMMFCAPTDPMLYDDLAGRMISLKSGASWGPGAFGLLDNAAAPDGPCGDPNQGANFWRCATGLRQGATICLDRRRGVDIRPGSVSGPTEDAINTRFDMFGGATNSWENDPNFAPAPNVIKGVQGRGNGCNWSQVNPTADTMGLPRDACFATNSCPHPRFGDGTWDDMGYMARNYGGSAPGTYTLGGTRHELYLEEITAAGGGDILTGRAETGRPECSSQMASQPERRVLVAAAIDCSTLPPGNASGVPVMDYWRIFLTEPAGLSANGDVWVEVVDRVGVDGTSGTAGEGILRDVVQLYR